MDGFEGIVQKINLDEGTVDVLIFMFGRDTPATLALIKSSKGRFLILNAWTLMVDRDDLISPFTTFYGGAYIKSSRLY